MNADAELDAVLTHQVCVARDHAVLNLDCAAHRVDYAAKLDDDPVASPFDDTAVAGGDCWVDEVAAQRPEPGERSLLVRPGEPAITDNVGNQDCSDLPSLAHGVPSPVMQIAQEGLSRASTYRQCSGQMNPAEPVAGGPGSI